MRRKLIRLDRGMKMPFGKHKGTVVDLMVNSDIDYAKWLWYENISPMTDSLDSFIQMRIEEEEARELQTSFNSIIRDELRGMTLNDIL